MTLNNKYNQAIGLAGGLQEQVRSDQVTVGTSSIVISPARVTNPKRKVITIRNTSDDATKIITIGFGNSSSAIANAGIVLRQYESFTDSQDGNENGGYMPIQGQINAICAVADGTLSIFER